jgi:hypothetical protein
VAAQVPDHYQTPYTPDDLAPQPESPLLENTSASRMGFGAETATISNSSPEARCEVKPDIFDR